MNLNHLLKDFTLGEKQESGVMSVVPLLSKEGDATDKMASFSDLEFVGTNGYGNMVFNNHSDKPFIIPTGYSVITKQLAQDHGATFAHLLKPNEHRDIGITCCIEQTQGGYIDGKGVQDFYLLPLYVRKKHFERYGRGLERAELNTYRLDFSRLWPIISEFQNQLVQKSEAHLVYFFNKFVDQLNQFNAEFEVVKGQRGAIILINNRIVGIEIAPTEAYWKVVWKRLIRDCYGSEVVRLTTLNLVKEFEEASKRELNLQNCTSIEDIEAALESYKDSYQEEISRNIGGFLEKEFSFLPASHDLVRSNSHNSLVYHVGKAKGQDSYAELYTEGEKVVYASILL